MNKSISISIIIPCYNCADLIGEALNSLSHQTIRDFEVICINDGSKDDTLQALLDWKKKDILNIRIIDQENGGVSRARNVGIEAAIGKYLLFLDADDCYHSQFIEYLLTAITQSNADVSYCKLSRTFSEVMDCTPPKTSIYTMQTQSQAMHNLMYRMADLGFYCYLYKRTVLTENNLRFDVNTKLFEDREFNWKYLCHCQTAAFVDAPLYWYRINENSVTQKKVINWRTDSIDAVKRIEQYLAQNNIPFYKELKQYLFARVIWSNAKDYATSGSKELFKRLCKEYDVRGCMKQTTKDRNWLVRLASGLYLIHPMLFYKIVRLKK